MTRDPKRLDEILGSLRAGIVAVDGQGLVELQNASEREKVTRHKPRNDRKREPGDLVTVEGEVAPGRNARSIRVRRAAVIK